MMRTCYIVGAGEFFSDFSPNEGDLVIAADGGYKELTERGIRCDLLVGDMDSIDRVPCGVEEIRLPTHKDETDMYVSYMEGVRRGYTSFIIYGGVGGREDHTFANYSLLIGAKERGHNIKLVGEQFDIFAVRNERIEIESPPSRTLSLFAFGANAYGVSVSGAEYEVCGITLTPSFPLGVSNSTVGGTLSIDVLSGSVLVMLER